MQSDNRSTRDLIHFTWINSFVSMLRLSICVKHTSYNPPCDTIECNNNNNYTREEKKRTQHKKLYKCVAMLGEECQFTQEFRRHSWQNNTFALALVFVHSLLCVCVRCIFFTLWTWDGFFDGTKCIRKVICLERVNEPNPYHIHNLLIHYI